MNIIGYVQLYIKAVIKFQEKDSELFYKIDTEIDSEISKEKLEKHLNEAKYIFENLGKLIGYELVSIDFCTKEEHAKSDGWPEYSYRIDGDKITELEPRNVEE